MASDVQTLQYIISFKTMGEAQATETVKKFQAAVGGNEVIFKKVSQSTQGLGLDIVKLAARAAITIPIWLAMRSAFMGTLTTISDGAKYIVEFDTAIRHMTAVSSEVANMPVFMKELGKEVQQLSNQTGRSLKEVSDIYYQFAETGMKATTAQSGMTVALKLAVATFGEAKETGRIMVDLYNMFGASMGNTMSPMEKMETIAGTFVTLWKENAGNLNEYIDSLKTFVPIAKLNNLTMKETLTTVVVLNNYMQRGSSGGTQLARAFQEMARNAARFDSVGINIRNRTDGFKMFMETLQKLNSIPVGTSRNSLMNSLFGERSQRSVAVLSLTDGLEKLGQQMNKMNAQDLASAQKALYDAYELQNRSLSTQVKVFDQLRKQTGAAFLIGIMGASDYEDAILKAGDALRGLNDTMINNVIPGVKAFGTTMNIAFKTALNPLTLFAVGIATLAFNFKGLTAAVAGLGTVIMAHPLIALAVALAAVTTAIVAFDNVQAAKKQATLNDIKEQMKAGLSLEDAKKLVPAPSIIPSKIGNWVETAVGKMFKDNPFAGSIAAVTSGFLASRAVSKIDPRKPITGADIDKLDKDIRDQRELEAIEKKKAQVAQETAELESLTLKEKLATANILKAYGYDSLTVEMRKYQIMRDEGENAVKLKEQELKILEEQIKVVNETAGIMSSKLNEAFTGILSGTNGFGSIGKALSDSMVEGVRTNVSEGLTNLVMSTGIGEMFGMSMSTVKGMFSGVAGKIEAALDKGGKTVYDWITKAFNYGKVIAGGGTKVAAMANAATGGATGNLGGFSSLGSAVASLPLFSYSTKGGFGGAFTGKDATNAQKGSNVTAGTLGGSLMTGYGMYQSTRQSGGSKGMGLLAGGLGAAGAIAGGLALSASVATATAGLAAAGIAGGVGGSLAGMGALAGALLTNPVGWVALGLMAAAVGIMMISGSKKKKKVDTTVQEQTTVNEVASKIDVSNKKLELINRNLVALRNTMETYILPTSAYFSTSRNLEDEFSLSARRG